MHRLRAALIVPIAEGAVLLVMAAGPSYCPPDPRTLLGVFAIGGVLGLVAGVSWISWPPARLAAVLAGVLLVWPPATRWLATVLPLAPAGPRAYSTCLGFDELMRSFPGPDGPRVIISLAIMAAAVPLAIWRRPPARTPDGAADRTSRVVRWTSILCIFGGPVLGLVVWLGAFPGDIYGWGFGVGLLVGLFGVLLFVGYAAFYALARSTSLAGRAAAGYAAIVILLPLVQAAGRGA